MHLVAAVDEESEGLVELGFCVAFVDDFCLLLLIRQSELHIRVDFPEGPFIEK